MKIELAMRSEVTYEAYQCKHTPLEEVASCHRETLDFVLSVQTLAGLHGQHNADLFLCRKRAATVFKASRKMALSS